MNDRTLSAQAQELRRAFDAAFADQPSSDRAEYEDFLLVLLANRPHALSLRELSAVHQQRILLGVPARQAALLGLAGIRGAFVPVFDLAALLGLGSGPRSPWIALCGASETVGFSFQRLERFLRVSADALTVASSLGAGRLRRALRVGAEAYPIVDLNALASELKGSGAASSSEKEK